MRKDLNEARFTGTAADMHPELKYLPSGKALLNAHLRCCGGYVKDGAEVEIVTEVPITVWGQEAERYAKEVQQGDELHVTGEVSNRKRQSKTGGEFDNVQVSVTMWRKIGAVVAKPKPASKAQDWSGDDPPPF